MEPSAFTRVRRLGTGAAGEVWLADGPQGLVALKLSVPGRSLHAEIAALGAVSHPSVPRLVLADPGGRWMVRAYAEGQRITSWAHGRSLPEIVDTFTRLAGAVQAIHDSGVIHGDLSPANVLVEPDGRPHVLDVGADVRGPNGALGWVAPERLRGENATVASDVYGLGAMLYAMTTGRPPYDRGTAAQLGWSAATNLPLPPGSVRPDLPVGLDELVQSALAWSPEARPRSAADVARSAQMALMTTVRTPVVGMLDERERLRRAIVEAVRGEGGLVVVYGPPGSGRRTLIDEAARAARREGAEVTELSLFEAARVLVAHRDAGVIVIDADGLATADIGSALDRAADSSLVLVRARSPVRALARRGAVHIRPSLLAESDIAFLLRASGRDPGAAADLWRRSRGAPGAVMAAIRGLDTTPAGLSPLAASLLDLLRAGPTSLPSLATRAGVGEHVVLDALDPCFASGAAWASDDGATLYAASSPGARA